MSEPKRYIFRIRECGCVKPEHLEGKYAPSALIIEETEEKCGWVGYEDYARLKAEVESLKAEPDALTAYLYADTLRRDDIKTLKAQVERLTKAGDEMARVVSSFGFDEAPIAWNRAKDGKGQP
jgi:hypothetical protein